MVNDPLADALNVIRTNEIAGKQDCIITPASKLLREVLLIFQKQGYVGDFEFLDNGTSGSFKVKLVGRVNSCGAIKPRYAVRRADWNKWEERYIQSKDFGLLIVSTPKGLMTNQDAKEKKTGGRLIAYVY